MAGCHLKAKETCYHIRYYELQGLKNFFGKLAGIAPEMKDAIQQHRVILTGDLNLHNLGETRVLYDLGFKDCWLDAYGLEDPGYTWDSSNNKTIS